MQETATLTTARFFSVEAEGGVFYSGRNSLSALEAARGFIELKLDELGFSSYGAPPSLEECDDADEYRDAIGLWNLLKYGDTAQIVGMVGVFNGEIIEHEEPFEEFDDYN
jgi:hypothetical protein